jgi:hypothetical protein
MCCHGISLNSGCQRATENEPYVRPTDRVSLARKKEQATFVAWSGLPIHRCNQSGAKRWLAHAHRSSHNHLLCQSAAAAQVRRSMCRGLPSSRPAQISWCENQQSSLRVMQNGTSEKLIDVQLLHHACCGTFPKLNRISLSPKPRPFRLGWTDFTGSPLSLAPSTAAAKIPCETQPVRVMILRDTMTVVSTSARHSCDRRMTFVWLRFVSGRFRD